VELHRVQKVRGLESLVRVELEVKGSDFYVRG